LITSSFILRRPSSRPRLSASASASGRLLLRQRLGFGSGLLFCGGFFGCGGGGGGFLGQTLASSAAADISAAGRMAFSGNGFFTASLIVTQPPLEPGNSAFDHDQATVGVGRTTCRFCVVTLRGTHVTGHLLALEHAARVLTLTGGAVRAVR
jgi:hypothetical protein